MTQIAYLLLAHRNPDGLIAQIELMISQGDRLVLHYDRNAPAADFDRIRRAFAGDRRVAFARRVRCGWGEWSLVQATLNAIEAGWTAFPEATHFAMISGDCAPIKPRAHIAAALAPADRDYIEINDFFTSGWIRTGLREERLIYRHPFNERRRKWLFYALLEAQKRLGLKRRLPEGLRICIGSQWWILRRSTLARLREFLRRRPDIERFFRLTWIPDETFFQTLVAHLVPHDEIDSRTMTFLAFSDYGLPMVLYDDHEALLMAEDHFFARKIGPRADRLRAALAARYAEPAPVPVAPGTGRALYGYLTHRGRHGLRHGPRIWEAGGEIGAGRALHLLLCKDWHLGRELAGRLAPILPVYGYVFQEEEAGLPAMGNLECGRAKRQRHRRAFLRVLFEVTGAERMLICLDPSEREVIEDLARDPCQMRVLERAIRLDDLFLDGHGQRLGLIGPGLPEAARVPIRSALARQIAEESRALERMGLEWFARIGEGTGREAALARLAGFLATDPARLEPVLEGVCLD